MFFTISLLIFVISCGLAAAGYALFVVDSCDDMPLNRVRRVDD